MLLIKDLMIKNVVTAKKDLTIKRAIEMLFEKHVGSVVIVDDQNKCLGIFTERDAIRLVAQGVSMEKELKDVMSKNVVTIGRDGSLEEARRLIISHGVRHLPILDPEGKLIGLLSVRDFLDELFGLTSSLKVR